MILHFVVRCALKALVDTYFGVLSPHGPAPVWLGFDSHFNRIRLFPNRDATIGLAKEVASCPNQQFSITKFDLE
jgi:hypothetical protein